MKVLRYLVILSVVLLGVGCGKKADNFTVEESNGISYFKNTEVQNDTSAKLDLKKVFTINADAQSDSTARIKSPALIIEDKDQNIYVLDSRASDIKKFNNLGEFQKTIGREGQGPGEFQYPAIMFICNDTLKVYTQSRKLAKFNLDGEFYYEKIINSLFFQNGKLSPDGKKSAYYYLRMGVGDNNDEIRFGLSVLDIIEVKEKSPINSIQFTLAEFMARKFTTADNMVPFCVGGDHVFLADKSDYQYKFIAYDFEGKKKSEIKKAYKKIRYDESEKSEYIENAKKKPHTGEIIVPTNKNSIQEIYSDKYGRVLVIPSVDRNIDKESNYIDIFKDGIFLNRVEYTPENENANGALWETNGEVHFSGTRMYFVNSEDLSIDVYDY
ncbi:MAG: 6-bladed beta-propeller [Candidatus Delongbacteria bacterium]|jgi:hypothetical protein|nr:6-bladed beta-propeller [Candidatus Delongbacteria bacterium]MDD4204963.1 6-bladed beta-propeller [Candidatus Delongbacteria bacterium]